MEISKPNRRENREAGVLPSRKKAVKQPLKKPTHTGDTGGGLSGGVMKVAFVNLGTKNSVLDLGWPHKEAGCVANYWPGRSYPVVELCFPNGKVVAFTKKSNYPNQGVRIFSAADMRPGDFCEYEGIKFFALVSIAQGEFLGTTQTGDLDNSGSWGVLQSTWVKVISEEEPLPEQWPTPVEPESSPAPQLVFDELRKAVEIIHGRRLTRATLPEKISQEMIMTVPEMEGSWPMELGAWLDHVRASKKERGLFSLTNFGVLDSEGSFVVGATKVALTFPDGKEYGVYFYHPFY